MKCSSIPAELKAGIERYVTDFLGTGGRIKSVTDDFQVREILENNHVCSPDSLAEDLPGVTGQYLHFVIQKTGRNWLDVSRKLCNRLGVSVRDLGYAGIKDANAVTWQRISVYTPSPEKVLRRKDGLPKGLCVICHAFRRRRVELGAHLGNEFHVRIRDADLSAIDSIREWVGDSPMIPNYFGLQRFGVHRSLNQEYGKMLLNGKLHELVTQLASVPEESWSGTERRIIDAGLRDIEATTLSSTDDREDATKTLEENRDNSDADFIRLENVLQGEGRDLAAIWISAAYSELFNRYLSRRLSSGKWNSNAGLLPISGESVDRKGSAVVTIPKQAGSSRTNETESDALWRQLFVEADMTDVLRPNRLVRAWKPVRRQTAIRPREFSLIESSLLSPSKSQQQAELESRTTGGDNIDLRFQLPKGSYATTLLREITKTLVF